MKVNLYALLVCLCVFNTSISQAGEALSLLEDFLHKTQTIEAKFQQKLLDSQGVLLRQSAGFFKLKRPGKFSWDYIVPYPQKIISNGTKIWIYDEELEQVSIKKYSQVLAGSPVILLNQQKSIHEDFNVQDKGFEDNQYWAVLTPKLSDSEFKKIEVGMSKNTHDAGIMRTMRLYDGFDQLTIIEFENLQMNIELDDKQFYFDPPKGTDVVGDF
jgi:outer membrane lipoprotein carrier protein